MITLRNLTHEYGTGQHRVRVLDDVSLTVERGEIAAVVGPSGAGKSTLAACINLLQRPTSGSVEVDGCDLAALRGRELRRARHAIGTVFQNSALLRRRTAAANLALPLEFLGVTRRDTHRRVGELLELVGLSERADAYVSELSGGQQQRVGIARALALKPSVLVADEATSGLDPLTTTSILHLIERLRCELDLTVVLITHEMDVVLDAADSVHRLDHGRIVETGRLTDVLLEPDSPLTQQLIPPRPAGRAQGTAWSVRFRHHAVGTDWLLRLGLELGVTPGLLGANIEDIDGVLVGHAMVDLPRECSPHAVTQVFARLGFAAEPLATPGSPTASTPHRLAS